MRRLRPVYGLSLVLLFGGAVLVADYSLERGFERDFLRVRPDARREVHIDVADLGKDQVRHYTFLNEGNQEVRFFVGRDGEGTVQVAFDASEVCFKKARGFRAQDGWMVCGSCDKAFRLTTVNGGGSGCEPIPVVHRLAGSELILTEGDLLTGWRLFR